MAFNDWNKDGKKDVQDDFTKGTCVKKKIITAVILLVICGLIFGGIYYNKAVDKGYKNIITLIENGSYEQALAEFENANPDVLERDDFKFDIKYGDLCKCYKNTVYLYAYALAHVEYNSENRYMTVVNDYLQFIPIDYMGELSEEIKIFKDNFKSQYEEYLAEQEREAKRQEQEYIASLKNKIPFEGMQEKYINSTAVGNADKHESKYVKGRGSKLGYDLDKYYWYSDNNKDMVLFVECKDGKVTDVRKYYESVYWTSDGMPKFWATRPIRSTKPKSSTKKEDPYNVNDYNDPEDFYDDNYDDFWDYEEAEDYYNSYHD